MLVGRFASQQLWKQINSQQIYALFQRLEDKDRGEIFFSHRISSRSAAYHHALIHSLNHTVPVIRQARLNHALPYTFALRCFPVKLTNT